MPKQVLLDADVPPTVAAGLRQRGHDVVAASGNVLLEALDDAQLVRLATQQHRVVVTFDIADFVEIVRGLASAQEPHAGIIVVHSQSYRRTDIGAIVRSLDHLLESRRDFTNNVLYLTRDQS